MSVSKTIACLVLFLPAVAAGQALPPLESYGALPTVDMLILSPSGKRIAYRYSTSDRDNILVVDLEAQQAVGGIPVGEISARRLEFIDDDNLIIVAGRTMRSMEVRGQFDYSGAIHLNAPKQEARLLLERADDLYPWQSGIGRIVGTADDSGTVLMPAFHSKDPRAGDPRFGVYGVNLSNHRAKLVNRGSHNAVDWFTDGNGELLVRVDYDDEQDRYRIFSLRDERSLIYEEETSLRPTGPVGLTPARNELVYAAREQDADTLSIWRMSIEDGQMTGPIMGREDASVEWVVSDIERVVHGVQYSGFLPTYEFFDASLDARVRGIQAALAGTSVRLVSWSSDFRDLVVETSGGWNAGLYLLFKAGTPEPTLLAARRPDIADDQVVPTEIVRYTARDGLEIPALVTARPSLRETGNAPLVVIPHGGPAAYDRFEFDWMAQYFASRGFVVLQPQFRGSSGFGATFRRAGHGEWGGKMQSDVDDGVDFLVEQQLVDPQRVCIVGASYGGYAALAAGAYSPGKYKCVASIAGVADLERMLRSDRRKYGRDHWAVEYWERQYGGEEFDWDALQAISPTHAAEAFQAPVLLIHGKKDTIVPIDQSKRMRKALKRAGKDVTLIELDGEDHWLSYRDSRVETLRALAAFIEEHL